jgi:hypothetical protein
MWVVRIQPIEIVVRKFRDPILLCVGGSKELIVVFQI